MVLRPIHYSTIHLRQLCKVDTDTAMFEPRGISLSFNKTTSIIQRLIKPTDQFQSAEMLSHRGNQQEMARPSADLAVKGRKLAEVRWALSGNSP